MATHHPIIIQGGMGIGVSNWVLAKAVAELGHMGVVSGTALDSLFIRRLQDGDPGGHTRRAMAHFPMPGVAQQVLERFFLAEGRPEGKGYKLLPMYRQKVNAFRDQITILANFVEVYLAKEGHSGPVGINLLAKVQMPTLASLYGAMLAGVDYVLMGAGIPREIPGALDRLARHEPASLKLDIEGKGPGEAVLLTLDPQQHWVDAPPEINRPDFLPIIASNSLAVMMARKANGRVDGFIIEGPTAGGHNAPPRGQAQLNSRGEPLYGERDEVDLEKMRELGLPFWLAGSAGTPEKLVAAREAGAVGIQVGTLFAYCDESGITPAFRQRILVQARHGVVDVITSPRASPTGFPFKVVNMPGSLVDQEIYDQRERICDLGYLRNPYWTEDGKIGYRCASEPVQDYVDKGGAKTDTAGRMCLCNSLMANIGHAQVRKDGRIEPPVITSGDELKQIRRFLAGRTSYTAADVIDYLT